MRKAVAILLGVAGVAAIAATPAQAAAPGSLGALAAAHGRYFGDAVDHTELNDLQTVRGHTLIWHSQSPAYPQALNPDMLITTMRNHITTLVTRYRGQLSAWDVVNEVLAPDGTLYINDFGVDGLGAKSDGLFNLVRSLLQQGVPIDGVGFQSHLAVQSGIPAGMLQNLRRFTDLGLDVAITGLDVRMRLPVDSAKVATQAVIYRDVTRICLAVPRCAGITVRTFTDKYSLIPLTFPNEGSAALSDVRLARKPAYPAVRAALGG